MLASGTKRASSAPPCDAIPTVANPSTEAIGSRASHAATPARRLLRRWPRRTPHDRSHVLPHRSSSSAPASAASPPPSSCAATALTTSRSSRARPTWAARGSTTAIRGRRATSPATCTRSPTSSARAGRGCARPSRRSSTTCARSRDDHGVDGLDPLLPARRRLRLRSRPAAAGRSRPSPGDRHDADVLILATGQLNRPSIPELPGLRALRRPQLPLGALGPRLRPARQARRGGRHRRQRGPVRARGGPRRPSRLSVFQRTGNWFLPRRNHVYPPLVRAAIRHVPGLQRLRRSFLFNYCESLTARHPPPAHGRTAVRDALGGVHAPASSPTPSCAAAPGPTTPSAASACCSARTTCPRSPAPTSSWSPKPIAGGHRERGCAPPTGACTRSTASSGGPASRPRSSWPRRACTGADGRTLDDVWSGGAHAHLGLTVPGFPSMFLMYGPNTNTSGGSIIFYHEAQAGLHPPGARAPARRRLPQPRRAARGGGGVRPRAAGPVRGHGVDGL